MDQEMIISDLVVVEKASGTALTNDRRRGKATESGRKSLC